MANYHGDASLPTDILYEIFSLLPSKTLVRFECVCKSFSALIKQILHSRSQTPRLLTQRLPRTSVKNTLFFSTYTYDTNEGFTLSKNIIKNVRKGYPWRASRSMPIQSCLGMVCIPSNEIIQLFNPSTEELIALPLPNASARFIGHTTCIGFGYAASTDKFKVIRFCSGDREIFCNIFALGTKDWRAPKSPPPYQVNPGRVPFLHGALHLLPLDADHTPDHDYIAAFNVESECYSRIPLPDSYYEESDYYKFEKEHGLRPFDTRHLTELGATLCLYRALFIRSYMCSLEIWLLKDYGAVEWVRGCNIDMDSLPDPQWMMSVDPIAIMGDGSILVCVYGSTHSQLLCYNPDGRIFTREIGKHCLATLYFESFTSLRSKQIPI